MILVLFSYTKMVPPAFCDRKRDQYELHLNLTITRYLNSNRSSVSLGYGDMICFRVVMILVLFSYTEMVLPAFCDRK